MSTSNFWKLRACRQINFVMLNGFCLLSKFTRRENLEMQSRFFKNPNYSSLFINWEKFGNIQIPRPTFQHPNVEPMDELGNLCPNLSFTVENKMGNSDGHISN